MTGERRDLVLKEEGTEYAQVLRLLGQGRVECNCFDGQKRMATIRGKLKNRVWINSGDIVLISLREFGDDKADVIHKYYPEEAQELQEMGEIPENVAINEGVVDEEEAMDGDDLIIGERGDDEDQKNDDLDIDDI